MNSPDTLMRLQDLRLFFDNSSPSEEVVRAVSITVASAEVLALVGESGCGKSSVALAIAGLLPDTASVKGRLLLARKEVDLSTSATPDSRGDRGVVLVPQEALSTLHPIFRIATQLRRVCRGGSRRPHIPGHFHALLKDLGFTNPESVLRSRADQLSGGMRQRVAIALALLAPSKLIIADEPTTALDPILDRLVMEKIIEHVRESRKGLLWISHDIRQVSELADRIAVMFQGRIVMVGSPSEVVRPNVHPYVDKLLKSDVLSLRHSPNSLANTVHEHSGSLEALSGDESAVLKASGLTKLFVSGEGTTVCALDRVSIAVRRGEVLSIVGGSGSGKTTLALCLAGLLHPNSGTVEFDGQNIHASPELALRRRLQILFQDPFAALDPRMTVAELLEEPLVIHRWDSATGRQGKLMDILASVSLPRTMLRRRPSEISAGQRQRVALGRALALDPLLLICDEPLVSLDSVAQFELLRLLIQLQRESGLSLVFITHDFRVACGISQRVAVLAHGSLVDSGSVGDLLVAPRHPWTKKLVEMTNLEGIRLPSPPAV